MMAAIFLSYAAVIWLVFDKLRLIRLSLPLAILLAAVGPLFAFYVIVSMNNFHPSSADARVFQRVVQVVPHITAPGRVKEIVAQPNAPLKQGDVVFTIDPEQFEFDVKRLEAALAAAEQTVPQLKSSVDQAAAGVEKANVQLKLAQADFDRQNELFEKNVIAQAALDKAERNRDSAKQAVIAAQAAEDRARLAYQSNFGNENTAVVQARQQLAQAKYNVEESIVRAPCDGYVSNIELVPGAVVSAAASVLPFVCERDERNTGMVVAPSCRDRICRSSRATTPKWCSRCTRGGFSRQGADDHRSLQRRTAQRERVVSGRPTRRAPRVSPFASGSMMPKNFACRPEHRALRPSIPATCRSRESYAWR